ncbi:hypothetical protein [Streptomyces typhae]|uniref:hypothetical protein n=1 Tax=Streptomyces typhae TaxID=2681492 RepID=UPI001FE88E73|nr:hypothetical protein [Streptomyces typhae]
MPSLALGILHTAAAERGHDVEVRYANLDFADWAAERAGFGLDAYTYFSEKSYFQGAGDSASPRRTGTPTARGRRRSSPTAATPPSRRRRRR